MAENYLNKLGNTRLHETGKSTSQATALTIQCNFSSRWSDERKTRWVLSQHRGPEKMLCLNTKCSQNVVVYSVSHPLAPLHARAPRHATR